jgi:hypothetical protein
LASQPPSQSSQLPIQPPNLSSTAVTKPRADPLNTGMTLISGLYSKMEERSKSPNVGFKAVQSIIIDYFSGVREIERNS